MAKMTMQTAAEAAERRRRRLGVKVTRNAVLSADGVYRYVLSRTWNPTLPKCAFLLLNPSTADHEKEDPTSRKCFGFASLWSFGGFDIVNVAAYRTSKPSVLYAAERRGIDVVGPENAAHVERVLREAHTVIPGWGAHSVVGFPAANAEYLARFERVRCLGRTKSWAPSHPLMLAYATELEPYATAGAR